MPRTKVTPKQPVSEQGTFDWDGLSGAATQSKEPPKINPKEISFWESFLAAAVVQRFPINNDYRYEARAQLSASRKKPPTLDERQDEVRTVGRIADQLHVRQLLEHNTHQVLAVLEAHAHTWEKEGAPRTTLSVLQKWVSGTRDPFGVGERCRSFAESLPGKNAHAHQGFREALAALS